MARAVTLSPQAFHLRIESPGQDLPTVIKTIEEVPDKVQDSVQNGWLAVLHNATGVEHRKPRVAGRELARE